MPTIYSEGGIRFVIWPNDHEPPHVHAFSADGQANIRISPLELWSVDNMPPKIVKKVLAIATTRQQAFLAEWEKIHG
jgi:hypothetical protein